MRVAHDAPSRPALRYYGGKWKLAPWIISHFPAHDVYLEPCAGAASVLMHKPRVRLETINDIDGQIVNFFQVLRDHTEELVRQLQLTPWARAEYELSKVEHDDPIEQARRFYMGCHMSISGVALDTSGARFITTPDGGTPAQTHTNTEYLFMAARRLMGVQIESRDALRLIKDYDRPDTLIYFDPPYPKNTRRETNRYRFEVEDDFHIEAAGLLRSVDSMVVISGYPCEMYAEIYEEYGWHRTDRVTNETISRVERTESLWLSPRTWSALNEKMSGLPLFANGAAR